MEGRRRGTGGSWRCDEQRSTVPSLRTAAELCAPSVGCQRPFSHLPTELRAGGARGLRLPGLDPTLDGVDHVGLEAAALDRVDLLHPRRTGDVHLGAAAADHVEPDEEQAVAAQARGDAVDDRAVALVERGLGGAPADVEVRAVLVL